MHQLDNKVFDLAETFGTFNIGNTVFQVVLSDTRTAKRKKGTSQFCELKIGCVAVTRC